jgi:tRNA-splicing ligase RtcB
MSEQSLAPVRAWLAAAMDNDVSEAIERLRRAPDVQQIAVMPDVHLAADVCIGVVVATSRLIYPQAVGGDIGCGMLAVAFDVDAGEQQSNFLQTWTPQCSVIPAWTRCAGRKRSSSLQHSAAAITSSSSKAMIMAGSG